MIVVDATLQKWYDCYDMGTWEIGNAAHKVIDQCAQRGTFEDQTCQSPGSVMQHGMDDYDYD